jgi:hypothetical protein
MPTFGVPHEHFFSQADPLKKSAAGLHAMPGFLSNSFYKDSVP